MPQLFTLPMTVPMSSVGQLLPGAKLYFFQTGTSTPQPVYQDIALTVAHAQPVVADGAGKFDAIYLDPALPHYRITLTDANDVTQPDYPVDNVPSNQNTAQSFRLKSVGPLLIFEETDSSSNNKKWGIGVSNETFRIFLLSDDEATETTLLTFGRTGMVVDGFDFTGQYLKVDGDSVATQESGTFTATLTGMAGATTGTVKWRRTGTKITLSIPSQIAGTSNATTMSMTGVPAGLLSAVDTATVFCFVRDNGATVAGRADIGTSSIVFSVGAAGVFTNSGSKGLPAGCQIIYDTDQSGIA